MESSEHQALAALAVDGDPATRWHAGHPQSGNERLTFDLGAARTLRALSLPLHEFREDYARDLAIDISMDGATWQELRRGGSEAALFTAALTDLRNLPLCYALDSIRPFPQARYIRLRQLGAHDTFYWSVPEAIVYVD